MLRPALVLSELRLPRLDGLTVARRLREELKEIRVVFLTTHDEVVRLIVGGHSMKQAAASLGLSTRTIAYHKYGAMKALDLASTAQLVRFAVESRLLPLG